MTGTDLESEWVPQEPQDAEEELIITVPLKTAILEGIDPSQYEDIADLVAGKAAKQAWLHMMRRLTNG